MVHCAQHQRHIKYTTSNYVVALLKQDKYIFIYGHITYNLSTYAHIKMNWLMDIVYPSIIHHVFYLWYSKVSPKRGLKGLPRRSQFEAVTDNANAVTSWW